MKQEPTPPPSQPPTTEERLEAMEFLLGQALLAIEADSMANHDQLNRLEAAIKAIEPSQLAPPTEEEIDADPFTMQSLGSWIQLCLERMRAHQSVSARQMVAIGELTDRVLSLGSHLRPQATPPIGQDAQAAIQRAQRPPQPD